MSRLAVGLRKQIGLVDGDVMIVDLPNSIQFCEIMLACASIGVVFSPVNPLYHSGKLEKNKCQEDQVVTMTIYIDICS